MTLHIEIKAKKVSMALVVESVFFLQLQTKINTLETEDEPQLQNILPHTNKIK